MWSCQHFLSCKTHVTGSRKTYSIFGIRDFPLFETGDSGFYSTIRASFGIESTSWGGEMQEIAIGIMWLNETLDRDYGIKEPYWGPLESGFRIRKIFLVEIQNVGNVSCGVQNSRLWNLEYRSRNLDPPNNCNPESSTWNPEYTAYNPESRNVLDSHMWDEVLFSQFQVKGNIRTRWKTKLTGFLRNLTLPYEYKKTLF